MNISKLSFTPIEEIVESIIEFLNTISRGVFPSELDKLVAICILSPYLFKSSDFVFGHAKSALIILRKF